MILGIGTDIVQIGRIEKIYHKYQQLFLQKILHPQEIKFCQNLSADKKINYLARRFAAKEAFAKALGTGIGDGLEFKDIAILNNKSGAPYIYLPNDLKHKFQGQNFYLSLSDDYPMAVAFVVISQ